MMVGVIASACVVPLIFVPLGGNAFGPPKMALFALGALLITLGFAMDPVRLRAVCAGLARSWRGRAVYVLIAAALLSTIAAADHRVALIGNYPDYLGLATLLAAVVVGFGAMSLAHRHGFADVLCRTSAVSLIGLSLTAVAELAGLPPAPLKVEGAIRVISAVGNSSALGVVLVLMLPLAIRCARHDVTAWRAVGAVASVGGLATLVWTLSRGAWIGLAVGAAVLAAVSVRTSMVRGRTTRATRPHRATVRGLAAPITGLLTLIAALLVMPAALGRAARVFDLTSATATWRLATWEATIDMVVSAPLTGFGPAGYRLGFLAFKPPGHDDGRLGYIPTEAAHNLLLDAASAFGLLGLVAVGVLAVTVGFRLARASISPDGSGHTSSMVVATAVSLAAGFTALHSHYVTLDSAPMLAVLIGYALAFDSRGQPEDAPTGVTRGRTAPWWALAVGAATLFAAWLVVAGTIVWADAGTGRALARLDAGSSWEAERTAVLGYVKASGVEPAVARAAGRAAGRALDREPDGRARDDGMAFYQRVTEGAPGDPFVALEHARFLMHAAARTVDPGLLDPAERLCAAAIAADPSSGLPRAVMGRIALMRGDATTAIPHLEEAVGLSPLHEDAWSDLVRAYEMAGDAGGAASASRRGAESLGRLR